MTWGDIGSTPLRLDLPEEWGGSITFDPTAGLGPTFQVPEQPRREQVSGCSSVHHSRSHC